MLGRCSRYRHSLYEKDSIEFISDDDILGTPKSYKKKGAGLKLLSDYMFGNIYIDPTMLLQMRLEAYDNNSRTFKMSKKIDEDLIHLLTKCFNPRKDYSES